MKNKFVIMDGIVYPKETAVRNIATKIFVEATTRSLSCSWVYYHDEAINDFKITAKVWNEVVDEVVMCLSTEFGAQVAEANYIKGKNCIDLTLYTDFCLSYEGYPSERE